MFGKISPFLMIALTVACARPVYQEAPTHANFNKTDITVVSLPSVGLKTSIVWIKQQTEEETGSFLLKFWRENAADNSPVPQDVNANVSVRLWMPSMGHGSSPVTVQRLDVGTYLVDGVYFSMPGDWDIEIELTNETELVDGAKIPIHY